MKILIVSKNLTKIEAAKEAFLKYFKERNIEVEGVSYILKYKNNQLI